ncbi:MAG: hypothetical protein HN597_03625 [Desulfobacula sp.]|jgi:hypothetical protein|uniref:Uncharacterized protein n=1 Tax=uncultured marine virus TaxID=186617 RepID=A0A0F7L3N8_9VIRU|nr:hypothetical protein [uncultured marine virus]MBT7628780.1 hypothetical protein [Desulfobacula sp.]
MSKQLSTDPIKKRAVLYIIDGGIIRFPGWALTTTRLGTMAEPFIMNARRIAGSEDFQDFDPSDPAVRVDELRNLSPGRENFIMSGEMVSGGEMLPRVFQKTGDFV